MLISISIILFFFVAQTQQQKQREDEFYKSNYCKKHFKYEENQVHKSTPLLVASDHRWPLGAFGHEEYRKLPCRVFFINGTKPRQQFVLSFPLKGGTTQTFQMIEKIINKNFKGSFKQWIYEDVQQKTSLNIFDRETISEILNDPNIPRLVIAQDPYTRMLSGYKDKVHNQDINQQMGFKIDARPTFDEYVDRIYSIRLKLHRGLTAANGVNPHFAQQVESAMVQLGMRYNYKLKLEEIAYWFSCFMDLVNIREEMMHGWPGKDDCFLSTPMAPCNGPSQNGSVITNLTNHGNHNYNSALGVDQHYTNFSTLQKTTEMYREDLVYFDYEFQIPPRQGIAHT